MAEHEEMDYRSGLLRNALAALPDRDRQIFSELRLKDEPVTLEALGKVYNISRERVRQLEVRAFEKVQRAVLAAGAPDTKTQFP